jgi:hypothetical protein
MTLEDAAAQVDFGDAETLAAMGRCVGCRGLVSVVDDDTSPLVCSDQCRTVVERREAHAADLYRRASRGRALAARTLQPFERLSFMFAAFRLEAEAQRILRGRR